MADAFSDVQVDLSAASAAAIADLQATAPTTPTQSEVEATTAQSESAAPVEEAASQTLPEGQAVEAAPETDEVDPEAPTAPSPEQDVKKWTVKASGKTVELTEDELVRRAQMGLDAERKWQQAAHKERELQQGFEALMQRESMLKQVVMDPAKLEQLRKTVQTQFGLPEDGDEVITAQQAVQMVQKQLEQQATQLRAESEARAFEREVHSLTVNYETQVANTIAQIAKDHPVLVDAFDDLSTVLRLDVARQLQANPTADINDVTKLMTQAARARATRLTATIDNHKKMATVRAAKGQEPSTVARPAARIDPPGGQGVRPTPTPAGLKLGDPRLTQSVVAELQEAFNRKA